LSGVNNSQLALWTVREYVLPDLANVITFVYKINLMQQAGRFPKVFFCSEFFGIRKFLNSTFPKNVQEKMYSY
jgi:hypothetical protein